MDRILTTNADNDLVIFQSVLELNKDGIVQQCLGKNCKCKGKRGEFVLDTDDPSVFKEFFNHLKNSEEIGLESYFTGKKGNFIKLTFMGRREDNYILIQSEFDKDQSGFLSDHSSDLVHIIDREGYIIFKNGKWKEKFGYESQKINIRDILLLEYKDSYASYLANKDKSDSNEPKVLGFKTESGDNIFVESKSQIKIVNGKTALVCVMRDVTHDVSNLQQVNDQSARIKAIFQTRNILFWSVNKNKALTSFNEAYSKTIQKHYGITPEVNPDLDLPKKKFASDDYHSFWDKKYEQVFNSGEGINFLTKTSDKGGKYFYRDIYLNPIISQGKIREVAGLAMDVTDQKLTTKKNYEQSKKINTIFNAANHMIWSVNDSYELTYFNEFYNKQVNKRFETKIELGHKVYELGEQVDSETRELWIDRYKRAFKGEQIRFETEYTNTAGNEQTAEISLNPIFDDEGHIIEVAGISQVVTYKKAAEKRLKAQAAKIQAIFDSTAMLIWTVDKDYHIVSYNKIFADQHFKLLGREVSIGSNFLELLKKHLREDAYEDLCDYFKGSFKGEKQQFEGRLFDKDGNKVWMETFFSPIYGDDNKIKEISCLSYNVTDKKIIEHQMQESINEKEILLQEVHHRVKNNLQVISSILNLQTSYVKDENTLNILRESQNRIKSMSFIHESLYQTKDFSGIEFGGYLLSLANNLVHSYSLEVGLVNLRTEFDDTYLSLDQAIPCGLIANELISNSLKYAFNKGQQGEIFVSATQKGSKVTLIISDNGKGLPEGFDYENSDSLGLQLVYTLKDQLDASIQVSTNKGTKYLITFDKQS
ncbi:PAS domain S-box protein [Cryomorphaceae bacterium 1068]|nr:PAS domain S-box protein [Cryomorphaceae bacterium 1068]